MTSDDTAIAVARVQPREGEHEMYNITTADTHTYYVVAGRVPVLVHNASCGPDIATDLGDLAAGQQAHVRIVSTEEELRNLFDKWSEGGADITPGSYDGKMVQLSDGTIVGLRNSSRSGGATIDIKLPNGSVQKVHIAQT